MPLQNLSLILGGAASGKSAYAEGLVAAAGRPRAYIATAEAPEAHADAEMAAKIARHRARRGQGWRLVEAPQDLRPALAGARPEEVVLLDALTLWLSNRVLAGADLRAESEALLAALLACPAPCVVVSDEVGLGLVPETPLGRAFRDALGLLNQAVAARAGLVALVVAGLPLALKGRLP